MSEIWSIPLVRISAAVGFAVVFLTLLTPLWDRHFQTGGRRRAGTGAPPAGGPGLFGGGNLEECRGIFGRLADCPLAAAAHSCCRRIRSPAGDGRGYNGSTLNL